MNAGSSPRAISYTAVPGFPLVAPGDDLAALIAAALAGTGLFLIDGDVVVVAQKIVSKAEDRYVDLAAVKPSPRAEEIAGATAKDPRYVEVVLSEAEEVLRQRPGALIVSHRLGFVVANAGIDESNISHDEGSGRVLLLPSDPDASAGRLKAGLEAAYGAAVGVIVIDSFGRAWRKGVVGMAIGAAGVPALLDLVGKPDLFGRPMRVTEVAVADQIAAGASLVMGEAAEGMPVVIVRGFASSAPSRPAADLVRPRAQDLFR